MVKGTLTGLSFCKGTYGETKGSNITNTLELRSIKVSRRINDELYGCYTWAHYNPIVMCPRPSAILLCWPSVFIYCTLLVVSIIYFFYFFDRKRAKETSYRSCIMRLCLEMKQRCKNCLEKELVSVDFFHVTERACFMFFTDSDTFETLRPKASISAM